MSKKLIDEIQSEVFKNLINVVMSPQGVQIETLDDLKQGTVLPKFTQVLLGEDIPGWKDIPDAWKNKPIFRQRISSQVSANLTAVMTHLSTKDKVFKFMNSPESDMIGFLSTLINKFYIVQPKKNLVNTIAQNLKDCEPAVEVKNMTSSWENGLPFIGLLSKASNGTIEYADKGDVQSNYSYIKESCESLNIPFVLTEKFISNKPDEICTCIQAILILKSMNGLEAPAQQSTSNEEGEKKKFEEKIEEYKKILQNAVEIIEAEQTQIDKLTNCFSNADITNKRNFIHKYQSSKKKSIQEQLFKVKESWDIVERNSNRTKIPIPSDLIKYDDVKQKIDQLEETVNKQNSNLDSDEKQIKKLTTEIENISTINQAREKFNEFKEKIDMDNWKDFPHTHLAYVLGTKLSSFEDDLKEAIEKFEKKKAKFEEIHKNLVKEIENGSDDLIGLDKSLSSLDNSLYNVKYAFNDIKKIDEKTEIEFSEEELKSKYDSAKQMLDENRSKISKNAFDKEYLNVSQKCESASSEIQKLDEYKNCYSSKLTSYAHCEHPVDLPSYEKLEMLLKEMKDDEDCCQKMEEVRQLVDKIQKEYDDAFVFLTDREKESKKIEEILKSTNKKFQGFKELELVESVTLLGQASDQITEIEKIKKWDENANGITIDLYNKCMKEAREIVENGEQIIEDKFNTYLEKIKESLEDIKEKRLKQTDDFEDDLIMHKIGLILINEDLVKFEVLKIADEQMNFGKKEELEEIQNDLEQTKQSIEELIESFPERIQKLVDEKIENLTNLCNESYIDELKSDSSKLDELDVEEIDKKGSKFIDIYADILQSHKFIEKYKEEYKLESEVPDTTEAKDMLNDLIILYKSTLLLNPKQCAKDLKERAEKCSDSNFSLSMALLYTSKFDSENNKYEIEDISEVKEEIESTINPEKSFVVEVSKEICERTKNKTIENQVKLIVLANFIEFYPEYKESLKDYLVTSIGNRPDINVMIDNLKELEYVPTKFTDIFKESFEKVDAIPKGKLIDKSSADKQNERTIVAEFGSFTTKVGLEGETEPSDIIRSIVGTLRERVSVISGACDKYVGEKAFFRGGSVSISRPIINGVVTNWDSLESIINDALSFRFEPEKKPVLCIEHVNALIWNRERIAQYIFEKQDASSFLAVNSNLLALYSTGRYTGFTVDCGYETTRFAHIVDGFTIPALSTVQNYGGKDIYDLLLKNLSVNHEFLSHLSGKHILEDVQEKLCYVADSLQAEDERPYDDKKYKLPDGEYFNLCRERYNCPEVLFNPKLNYKDVDGIPQSIWDTIMKIDIDYRQKMASNIVLVGGPSKMPGFTKRVEKDLIEIAPSSYKFDFIKPEFDHPAWVGGSIMSQLDTFPQMLISKEEYYEVGAGIIHRKCIY